MISHVVGLLVDDVTRCSIKVSFFKFVLVATVGRVRKSLPLVCE